MSRNRWVEEISRENEKKSPPGPFSVGDEVDVHVRIKEGEKERVQIFRGVVISRKGFGSDEAFTVRRVVQGEGVERVFPLHSPFVEKVAVRKRGRVRRSKLYYLRERTGRAARIEELRGAPAEKAEKAEKEAHAAAAAAAAEDAKGAEATAEAPAKDSKDSKDSGGAGGAGGSGGSGKTKE